MPVFVIVRIDYKCKIYGSPSAGSLKSPTWHKMEKEGLQDAVEESEQRRMLLVNRLKDAQDTLKVRPFMG